MTMLKIRSDLHTHTTASHGKGSMEDNVRAAAALGLQKIAITDHGPAHLFGVGIANEKVLLQQKAKARQLAPLWPQIEILVGVEANIISPDGRLDVSESILEQLDIVLIGLHPRVLPASAGSAKALVWQNWLAGFPRFQPAAIETNTAALIRALERYRVDVVAHPGLHLRIDTLALAAAAAKRNVALELSAGHHVEKAYLERVLQTPAKLVISSDAHRPEDVGSFLPALKLAAELKIPALRILNASS
jgi:putative hydrolase